MGVRVFKYLCEHTCGCVCVQGEDKGGKKKKSGKLLLHFLANLSKQFARNFSSVKRATVS